MGASTNDTPNGNRATRTQGTARRALVAAAGAAFVLTSVNQAHASVVAYLWADQPNAASYTPNTSYQYNRVAGGPVNRIYRYGVGVYTVLVPRVASFFLTAHATAYGSAGYCKISSMAPAGSDELIGVRCFSNGGVPEDARFTLAVIDPRTAPSGYGWVKATQPTTAVYFPSDQDSLYAPSADHDLNSVTRLAVGVYKVQFPGLADEPYPHVLVTAYGTGSQWCKVGGSYPGRVVDDDYDLGDNLIVDVRCFTAAGTPADAAFIASFVTPSTLFTNFTSCGSTSSGICGGFAWANRKLAASYAPHTTYQYNSAYGLTTVNRIGIGSYSVKPPFATSSGTAIVTAVGTNAVRCKVAYWNSTTGISVQCFSSSGAATDAEFNVLFAKGS